MDTLTKSAHSISMPFRRLPHSCTTSSGMTARSLICSGSSCTTSSGITARSSICSGSTCAERFHGHGGAAMAAMAASWQQQPAQRARAGGGRNAGARPPRARASRPASHLDTAFFARRGLHRRVLLLCGVVCRRHEVCKPRRKWSGPPAPTNQSRRHRSRSFPENQAKKGQTVSKRNEDALRRPPCVQKELPLCRPCATPACTPGEVVREETVLAADSGPWPLSCKPPSRSQQLSSVWLESWASMLSAL